jgi:hypothetical protein
LTGRTIRLAVLLSVSAVVGVLAAPSQAANSIEAQCNSKTGSYLFWPHGHPAIPDIGFPAFATPHLELYAGQRTKAFPDSAQDAVIVDNGGFGAAKKCRTSSAGFINAHVNHARHTRRTHEISCNFKHHVSDRIGKSHGGARLQTVLSGGAVVVDVKMGPSGSSITWDKRFCKALPAPS